MSTPISAPPRIERLILHIGTYKTGTSSIQRYLDRGRRRLEREGICYPAAGCGPDLLAPAHHRLALLADQGEGVASADFSAVVDEIRREFADSGCGTLVLSAEDLSAIYFPHVIVEAFPAERTEIFVSLRPQHDIISPLYYTAVAMRRLTASPEEYLEAELRSFLDYHVLLQRWRSACPTATFHVRRYEEGSPSRKDSILDFLEVLKIPPSPLRATTDFRDHATLPARGTLVLRMLATLGYSESEFYLIFDLLQNHRQLLGREMSVYSPNLRREVHETYRESNRRVRAEFVDGVAADLFQEPNLPSHEQWAAALGDSTTIIRDVLLRFAEKASGLEPKTEA